MATDELAQEQGVLYQKSYWSEEYGTFTFTIMKFNMLCTIQLIKQSHPLEILLETFMELQASFNIPVCLDLMKYEAIPQDLYCQTGLATDGLVDQLSHLTLRWGLILSTCFLCLQVKSKNVSFEKNLKLSILRYCPLYSL